MAAYGYRVGAIKAQIDLTEKHAFYDKIKHRLFLYFVLVVDLVRRYTYKGH